MMNIHLKLQTFQLPGFGDKSKTVKDYYGAPENLKNLEKLVEGIAESDDGWSEPIE